MTEDFSTVASPDEQVTATVAAPTAPAPERVVSEATARSAIAQLMAGTRDMTFVSSLARERFVADAVASSIAKHEEAMSRGGLTQRPGKKQRKLDGLKDAGDGLKTLERPLSKTRLRAMRRQASKAANAPLADVREGLKLRQRLDLLRLHPEWDKRLTEAYFAAGYLEMRRLVEGGHFTDDEVFHLKNGAEQVMRNACVDGAMEVVDDSSAIFGDWRTATKEQDAKASAQAAAAAAAAAVLPATGNPIRDMRDRLFPRPRRPLIIP